jgi:hypothetical protein
VSGVADDPGPLPRSTARAPPPHRALRRRHVLVVGDVMLDRFLVGRVSRISPEAPVPVVEFDHDEYRLGGAANVAHNIARSAAGRRWWASSATTRPPAHC